MLGHNSLEYTFGGFAEGTWKGDDTYDRTSAGNFLFRLGGGAPEVYRPKGGEGEGRMDYQYHGPEYWPAWGSGSSFCGPFCTSDISFGKRDLTFGGEEYGAEEYSGELGRNGACNQGNRDPTYTAGVTGERLATCGARDYWGV